MGSEIFREVLADKRSVHLLVTENASDSVHNRLTAREWLLAHVWLFLIGAWNLLAIDFAHTSDRWWSWIPIVVWSGVLILHAIWVVLIADRHHTGHRSNPGKAHGEGGADPDCTFQFHRTSVPFGHMPDDTQA